MKEKIKCILKMCRMHILGGKGCLGQKDLIIQLSKSRGANQRFRVTIR